jgi:hypothetical protein
MQKRQNCRPQALRQDAGECVVTGSRIVHACHVVPQCFGDDEYRRICGGSNRNEPTNLLLLTPSLHTAFDQFMFSFAPTGRGTHAVEVYVSDTLLDPYAGRIVRLAAGDAQLAAHRAACGRQGRAVGSQEREDDPDWDARTTFSTACEDVRPATRRFPDALGGHGTTRVSFAPKSSAERAVELVGLQSSERSAREIFMMLAFGDRVDCFDLVRRAAASVGITFPEGPERLDDSYAYFTKTNDELEAIARQAAKEDANEAAEDAKEEKEELRRQATKDLDDLIRSETQGRNLTENDYIRGLNALWKQQNIDMGHVALLEMLGGLSDKAKSTVLLVRGRSVDCPLDFKVTPYDRSIRMPNFKLLKASKLRFKML